MKRAISYVAYFVVLCIVMGGCGTSKKEIIEKSKSERVDVFSEITGESIAPEGFSDLVIKTSVKTHLEGFHLFPEKSLHGKTSYSFVANIDGQGILWEVEGETETTPVLIEAGVRDPEGGEGMKYTLEKKIRLLSGTHTLFFGLPAESYSESIKITVKSARQHVFECRPVYKLEHEEKIESKAGVTKLGQRNIRSFKHGLKECEILFDGIPLRGSFPQQ